MANLLTMAGRPSARPTVVVMGGELMLKLIPIRGERLPFTIRTNSLATADVTRINNRMTANFTTFTLRGRAEGQTLLEIMSSNGVRTLPIAVTVLERFALPSPGMDVGLLTRLFLAETLPPETVDDLPDLRLAMALMRRVIENRLARPSGRWASAGARSRIDVVRARGQFEGFSNYPDLPFKIETRLDRIVSIANDTSNAAYSLMREHLTSAMAAATNQPVTDPTRTGLYWWKTKDTDLPGTGVVPYRTIGRNTFYREGP